MSNEKKTIQQGDSQGQIRDAGGAVDRDGKILDSWRRPTGLRINNNGTAEKE